jgi:hypothetical protein
MEQFLHRLRRRRQVSYRILKPPFTFEDDDLADLKAERLDTPGSRTAKVREGRPRSVQV